jgi:hypothetical protein
MNCLYDLNFNEISDSTGDPCDNHLQTCYEDIYKQIYGTMIDDRADEYCDTTNIPVGCPWKSARSGSHLATVQVDFDNKGNKLAVHGKPREHDM